MALIFHDYPGRPAHPVQCLGDNDVVARLRWYLDEMDSRRLVGGIVADVCVVGWPVRVRYRVGSMFDSFVSGLIGVELFMEFASPRSDLKG